MAIETLIINPELSSIRFSLRHLVISEITGTLTKFRGVILLDTVDPTRSTIDLDMEAGSLETGDPDRNEHICSAEFLNVKRFPEMRFRSHRINRTDRGAYELVGLLTIRDVSCEVSLEVEDRGRGENLQAGAIGPFAAHGTIDRRNFGLRWNQDLDTGGVVVGDKIDIRITLDVFSPATGDSLPRPEARA